MVVGRADEPDLEAVLQIEVAEPLEGAVHGVDLGQALELGVALGPVAGHVRVRDHHHVLGRRPRGASPRRARAAFRLLHRHPAVVGRAEEHVVVAAARAHRGPLVAEERDQTVPSVAPVATPPAASSTRSRPSRSRARTSSRSRAASPPARSGSSRPRYPGPRRNRCGRGSRPRRCVAVRRYRAPGPDCWWRAILPSADATVKRWMPGGRASTPAASRPRSCAAATSPTCLPSTITR